jgi:6-phosphogluconolactonase/glucosamine-6-phosphate isomerase/deaminase
LENTSIFGMGPDGHTAGIKPHSPAVWSPNLVADFVADDFERITITPAAIKKLDAAVVQISGQNKVEQLNNLLDCDLTLDNQPAQILKAIPNLTIFSDIKR